MGFPPGLLHFISLGWGLVNIVEARTKAFFVQLLCVVCQEFLAWEERMFVKPSVCHVRFVGRTRDSESQQVFAAIIGQDFVWKREAVGASPS